MHSRFTQVFEKSPIVGIKTFIAPSASLVGNINLGNLSSIWYAAVLRGK